MQNVFTYQGIFFVSITLKCKEIKVNETFLAQGQHFNLGYVEKELATFLPQVQIHAAKKWVTRPFPL